MLEKLSEWMKREKKKEYYLEELYGKDLTNFIAYLRGVEYVRSVKGMRWNFICAVDWKM